MPFSVVTQFSPAGNLGIEDFAGQTIGGVTYNREEVANAIRLAIRDTMRQYTNRVNTLTFYWKPENKPQFASNFRAEQQLGLQTIESQPIVFVLENTRIWGLVSAGSPEHEIKPKPGNTSLRFTGWEALIDYGRTTAGGNFYIAGTRSVDIGRSFRARAGAAGRGSLGRVRTARLASAQQQRGRRSTSPSYPPTYIPATKPLVYSSGAPPRALGNATIRLRANSREPDGLPVVHHPGFEGRNLTGILLGTHGRAPGGDLNDYYANQVYVRLDQTVPDSQLGRLRPDIRPTTGRQEFVIEPRGPRAGRQTFAIARFGTGQ